MALRSSVFITCRQTVERVGYFYNNLLEIGHHEGWGTAVRVLSYRIGRYIKHKLVSLRHRKDLPPKQSDVTRQLDETQQLPEGIKEGILFVGYVEANLGLGESLRGLINSISEFDVPFAILPFNVNVESRVTGPFRADKYDLVNRYPINVIETATDQLPHVLQYLGEQRAGDSYNILRTYWELPKAPSQWAPFLESIDEIWAPNAFVADAFRPIFQRAITIIPPCVEVDHTSALDRSHFAMIEGVFYYLFSFDYFSFPARKNPIGVLRAFQAAFPKGDERVGLVIKSTGSQEQFPEIKAIISRAARLDKRIVLIDRTLTRSEIVSLIACSDCYVSLHRSEGFGLGMVEAMALGKPVIGTDFSGSVDFLSDATGYPIPCVLRPVRRGEYVYFDRQAWAEPDGAAAAATMRHVLADPDEARAKAKAAQAFVLARYGRENVGRRVEERVRDISTGEDVRRPIEGPLSRH